MNDRVLRIVVLFPPQTWVPYEPSSDLVQVVNDIPHTFSRAGGILVLLTHVCTVFYLAGRGKRICAFVELKGRQ